MGILVSFSCSFLLFSNNTLAFQPKLSLLSKQVPLLSSKDNINTTPIINGGAPILKSMLQKPSKVLTVGLEYISNKQPSPSSSSLSEEISTLSMQLRKLKVSAIWCDEVESLQDIVKEQETARGNFPGPCPVIYHGPLDYSAVATGKEYGAAAAVVVSAGAILDLLDDDGLLVVGGGGGGQEIIWKVSSVEEVQVVLERTGDTSDVFWLDDVPFDTMEQVVACLPKKSMFIASVDPMQPDGAEVDMGKKYKGMGCASIFVRQACVGDAEDLEYAQFLVGRFTSKASSEFKFTGLTGSTNGHFGGVQASGSVKWKRVES